LSYICNKDGNERFFVNGVVYTTGLKFGATANYNIASEVYPDALKTSRKSRYDTYIVKALAANGNQFAVLLDELTAYSSGAQLELGLLKTHSMRNLTALQGDFNI